MFVPLRRTIARDHGAALVRGWVALYTLGLPDALRARRRGELAADLAEEAADAVRRATLTGLAGRRVVRLVMGVPSDLAWRLLDAPAMAAELRVQRPWVPPTRWILGLLAIAAIGTAGALVLVAGPILDTSARPDPWLGWGPYGFAAACVVALLAIVVAVPAPPRAIALVIPAAVLGTVAAPWMVAPWLLVVLAVGARWYEARSARGGGW
jgi:hypothetical protein